MILLVFIVFLLIAMPLYFGYITKQDNMLIKVSNTSNDGWVLNRRLIEYNFFNYLLLIIPVVAFPFFMYDYFRWDRRKTAQYKKCTEQFGTSCMRIETKYEYLDTEMKHKVDNNRLYAIIGVTISFLSLCFVFFLKTITI